MSTPATEYGLSAREQEVCHFVCQGWTNKEIAKKLQLSPRSVEDYRMNAMRKYGATNVVLLMRKVYKLDEVLQG